VRVRDHILFSTVGAALLAPRLGLDALDAAGWLAGGVLVDVDHYVWFCLRHRHLSPGAAARFFNGPHPSQAAATRALHHPLAIAATLALATRRRGLRPLALGMSLHIGLDVHHEARMNRARAKALARDCFSCQACGRRAPQVEGVDTHQFRQPWLLPDYGARNLVSLCSPCHEVAHARCRESSRWQ
jgi:hypothetical protein